MENKDHWNKKVAKNRGLEWRRKLLSGRLDVQTNPTRVRLARIEKNNTQNEISKEIGMSATTYASIESGRRPVRKDHAEKIAKALGLPFKKAFTVSEDNSDKFVAKKE